MKHLSCWVYSNTLWENEIFHIFNIDIFIYYDIENPDPALSRFAYLESNHSTYMDTLIDPILANGKDTIEEFFFGGWDGTWNPQGKDKNHYGI